MPKITATSTIKESKEFLRENFEKGCECPSCGQFVKNYKRKLNSSQARCLIALNKLSVKNNFDWVHITEIAEITKVTGTGDFAKLLHWKLIQEKKKSHDDDKRNSGYWKITQKGISFVNNKIKIPAHIFIYNAKLQGFSVEETTILESLGKKFSYNELMNKD